ncbi:MAG: 50S ribosomal protein L25/general stress protein Ctc [Gammaproteobacteria bacterium]|nr:50S ribosomal protein L25/general stress protein Ctc [Gammaproteobacteria bacterium]TVQ44870.1 MAG: 50S ribosomal protein L25/general stress protein Ctc [Gammaproteobacteria bacterium]
MSIDFVLQADIRDDQGKGASRRLRRTGKVPAVVYGAGRPARAVALDQNAVKKALEQEAFYSSVIQIRVGERQQPAILKDVQRHPAKGYAMHLDFQRIVADEKIRMSVPVHLKGESEAPGIRTGGGLVSHLMNEVEISCLPGNLPEYLELDISGLEVDDSLHLSEIPLPEGVEIIQLQYGEDHDQPVVAIVRPRVEKAEDDAQTAPEADAESDDDA